MDKTYFAIFNAYPTISNPNYGKLEGALVHIWVLAKNNGEAEERMHRTIIEEHWKVVTTEQEISETTQEHFAGKPEGLVQGYLKAQLFGKALILIGYLEEFPLDGVRFS